VQSGAGGVTCQEAVTPSGGRVQVKKVYRAFRGLEGNKLSCCRTVLFQSVLQRLQSVLHCRIC
jgi:hypothetical protein